MKKHDGKEETTQVLEHSSGRNLREEFLKPMRMTPYELAKRLRVPPPRINDIVLEKRGITADTAWRWGCRRR